MRSPARTSDEDILVAAHEAGHGIAAFFSRYVQDVTQLTIVPNGRSKFDGCASYGHAASWSRVEAAHDDIAIKLGGLAAEAVTFGKLDTGGGRTDLLNALQVTRLLIKSKPKTLTPPWGDEPATRFDVSAPFRAAGTVLTDDEAMVLNAGYRRARALVSRQKAALEVLTHALVSERTLDVDDVKILLGERPWVIQ